MDAVTRSLAIEYADRRIRVNAVALTLGIIKMRLHASQMHASVAGLHPLKRPEEVSDVVEAVLYLESAPFVTGWTLHVDDGVPRRTLGMVTCSMTVRRTNARCDWHSSTLLSAVPPAHRPCSN